MTSRLVVAMSGALTDTVLPLKELALVSNVSTSYVKHVGRYGDTLRKLSIVLESPVTYTRERTLMFTLLAEIFRQLASLEVLLLELPQMDVPTAGSDANVATAPLVWNLFALRTLAL